MLLEVHGMLLLLLLIAAVSSLSTQQLTVAKMTAIYGVVVVTFVAPVEHDRSAATLLPLGLFPTGGGGAGELEGGYAEGQAQGHHPHPSLRLLLLPLSLLKSHRPTANRGLVGVALVQALEGDVPEAEGGMVVANVEKDLAGKVPEALGEGEAGSVSGGLNVGAVGAGEDGGSRGRGVGRDLRHRRAVRLRRLSA